MSQVPQAQGLSPEAFELIESMLNSGDSQQVIVAEGLDTIASNGDGQEEDDFLISCAQEIAAEAAYFASQLRKKKA